MFSRDAIFLILSWLNLQMHTEGGLHRLHFIYPLSCWWTLRGFYLWATANNAALDGGGVHTPVWISAFSALGWTPRSYDKSLFDFLRNCCTVFHSGCTISHFHHQCPGLPTSPDPHQHLCFPGHLFENVFPNMLLFPTDRDELPFSLWCYCFILRPAPAPSGQSTSPADSYCGDMSSIHPLFSILTASTSFKLPSFLILYFRSLWNSLLPLQSFVHREAKRIS